METISKAVAIKTFFSPPEVSNKELMELVKIDKVGYDELARDCATALGKKLEGESETK